MSRQNHRPKARGLGAELADLRHQAGLTLSEVGKLLDLSAPTLSRIENGSRDTSSEEVAALLVVYKITGARKNHLVRLARTIDQPGWWETSTDGIPGQLVALRAFESEATRITEIGTILVPGILQTAGYAREVLKATVSETLIDARLDARMERQAILDRRHPPLIHTIIDESVLNRPAGDPRVMAVQLRHILKIAARPNITVQILRTPLHRAVAGSYITLEFPQPAQPFVHLEHIRSSMFLDEPEDVDAYLATTATLAETALDREKSRDLLANIARRYEAMQGGVDDRDPGSVA